MRLLETKTHNDLVFTKDFITDTPDYAILSHTWGSEEDEITFEDVKHGAAKNKKGYDKIRFCQDQIHKDGLQYFWIDTCCIDRANHTELASAIVSMYQWYRDAAKCYVFLSDVYAKKRDHAGNEHLWEEAFGRSRWFKRGWTLQELLAPSKVEFYSREGLHLGDKSTLESKIHKITGIPLTALRGATLSNFTAAERMRWAAGRDTQRLEDQAYCLLGIFDVSMSPVYGEGSKAFVRLKDEIGKAYRRDLERLGSREDVPTRQNLNNDEAMSPAHIHDQISAFECRDILLRSLRFDQMDHRRSTIKTAYSTTCRWILEHPSYLTWIDPHKLPEHYGFLWIKGKPGAGKSTLVKFAYAHAHTEKSEEDLLVSFFFNARGSDLERSSIGMYRALLFQLVDQCEPLHELSDSFYQSSVKQAQSLSWKLDALCELLSLAVGHLKRKRLCFFIDALDECDEQQVRDMIDYFEGLAQATFEDSGRLYICFASRHYPAIDICYGCQLVLEDEAGHDKDLARYVQSHLRAGHGKFIETIRRQILDKAKGVFLWAVLVVEILNKEFRGGRIFAVKRRLEEIPPQLSDLFKDVLQRDQVNMADFLLSLQWILFAQQPLSREEFYFAMAAGLDSDPANLSTWNPENITTDDMTRFVLHSSKGLAEITKDGNSKVQFIHESVRDFLLKDNGLQELWPLEEQRTSTICHERLKQCCMAYLNVNWSQHVSPAILKNASDAELNAIRRNLMTKLPFLEYACKNVLYHANEAAVEIAQDQFLMDFPFSDWVLTSNSLEENEGHWYSTSKNRLYILADHKCARLIVALADSRALVSFPGERYRYPFFAALAKGHKAAMRALLQVAGSTQEDVLNQVEIDEPRKDHTPLLWAVEKGHKALAEELAASSEHDINATNRDHRSALSIAVERGFESLVKRLLLVDGIKVNLRDGHGRAALSYAAQGGHPKIIHLLLDGNCGVKIDEADSLGLTALGHAVKVQHHHVVELLLGAGANIEAKDIEGRTPLLRACMVRNERLVRLLLEKKADVRSTCDRGRTALLWAALSGDQAVVQLLLDEYGADINHADEDGFTALMLAIIGPGHDQLVELLLERGANIEAKNKDGRNALSYAAELKSKYVTESLITKEADISTKDNLGMNALMWVMMQSSGVVIMPYIEALRADVPEEHQTKLQLEGFEDTFRVDVARYDSTMAEHIPTRLRRVSKTEITDIAHLLISKDVDLETQSRSGKTALILAAEERLDIVVHSLLHKGVRLEARDQFGRTAMLWAACNGSFAVVRALLDYSADADAADDNGKTIYSWGYRPSERQDWDQSLVQKSMDETIANYHEHIGG